MRRRSDDGRETRARSPSMPSAASMREEALADCRCRPARARRCPRTRSAGCASSRIASTRPEASRLERHRATRRARGHGAWPPGVTSATIGIDLVEPRRGLAQRPRRQQPAVAEAARGIDHGDLDVARQRVVLQAVVGDDHVARRDAPRAAPRAARDAVGARPRPACRCARAAAARRRPRRGSESPARRRRAPRRVAPP